MTEQPTPEINAAVTAAHAALEAQDDGPYHIVVSPMDANGVAYIEGPVDLRIVIVAAIAAYNTEALK